LIHAANGEALFVKADVARADEVETLVKQTVTAYGRLDCAHNNAGVEGRLASTAEYTEEEWDRVIAVNLKGIWLCMKYEIAHMLTHGRGAIVNTASGLGLVGLAMYPAYSASKHGVVGLTKTAALEYAKSGIRVNAICPGVVQTPMIDRVLGQHPHLAELLTAAEPIGRLGRPEEMAEAAVWLCSDAASFVTGHAMAVDGGYLAQ
jgi:NAD(P)-dependent dehydrogenase (short-subunit alcohol dehydrogenase family)